MHATAQFSEQNAPPNVFNHLSIGLHVYYVDSIYGVCDHDTHPIFSEIPPINTRNGWNLSYVSSVKADNLFIVKSLRRTIIQPIQCIGTFFFPDATKILKSFV